MTKPIRQRLTYPLITSLILMLLIISGYIYFDHLFSKPIEIKNIKIDTKAALKLNILKQISKKNGITEWELSAASATVLKDEDKAILETVSIFFYTKENKKVHLTSKKGVLNTKTHDMTFSNDVVVTYETSVLRTDKLQYHKKEHIIHSDTHVTLERGHSFIEADSMTTRLNDNLTILDGHVKGSFSENLDIR
ncbi:MAG: LPS export ABC transporter periplasmic protein LptC [Pseudomonadota bacterium]